MQLLVRNRVADFQVWLDVFNADTGPAAEYGLSVAHVWHSADDPNDVFFLLDVADKERAIAFMARPESEENGRKSGVIDGEYHFLKPAAHGGG